MAKNENAIVIDTQLNNKKIETDFKKIDKQTKNMINRYNKSVDSIKKQELALEKVKQKLNDIESGDKVPTSIKSIQNELNKVNKELEIYDKKANEISGKQQNLSFELNAQKDMGDLINGEEINRLQVEIQNLDDEMLMLASKEEQTKIKAMELTEKLSELKNNTPEVQQLKQQIDNMTSSLTESKKQAIQLGEEIENAQSIKSKILGMGKGFEEIGQKVDKFKTRMTRLIGTVAIFNLLRNGLTKLRNGFISLLKQNDGFNNSLNQIKANLMTAFAPIYNACLPAINSLMSTLSELAGTVAVFVSGLFGTSLEDAKKQAKGLSKSLEDVGKKGEEASGGLAGFDKLEVIGGEKSSSGSSGNAGVDYSGDIKYSENLLNVLNRIKNFIVENEEIVIGFIAGITTALITLKIKGIKPIQSLGIGIAIGGLVILIKGIIDFIKDPSWKNFGTILSGLSIILAGVAIAMLAVNSANPVAWIMLAISAVAALGAIIIKYKDEIMGWLSKAGNWVYEKVIGPIVNFFANMWNNLTGGASKAWDGIKNVFSTVANFFKDIFSKAWNGVKKVFSTGGKIFDGIKDGIVSAFTTIVNSIIGGINKVIAVPFNGINTALKKIKKIDILGLKPFDWISTISVPQIPKLATGAVIPPRSEFMAILGDQKRGVNIETPLDTMVEAFNKALDNRNSNGELVIENLTIVNRIGNTDISKTVVKGVRIAEKQLGKPLFVN